MREGAGVGIHVVAGRATAALCSAGSPRSDRGQAGAAAHRPQSTTSHGRDSIRARSRRDLPPGRASAPAARSRPRSRCWPRTPAARRRSAALAALAAAADRAGGRPAPAARPAVPDGPRCPSQIDLRRGLGLRGGAAPAAVGDGRGRRRRAAARSARTCSVVSRAFVIAGPPRSGRSTALLTMARSLLRCRHAELVHRPRRAGPRCASSRAARRPGRSSPARASPRTSCASSGDPGLGRPYVVLSTTPSCCAGRASAGS